MAIRGGVWFPLPQAALKKDRQEILTTLPSFGWLVIFMLVPSLLVLGIAFRETAPAGGIGSGWTLAQFRVFGEKSIHILLWRTLWISAVVTGICLVFALPVAWYLARMSARWRPRLLLLIIVPFWTNFLIRVFAWNQILHSEGALAKFLRGVHLLGENESLLFNSGAVVLVSVYTYLPFAILPLYAAAEKFDFGLIEAARDLGASAWQAFIGVFLPGIRKGLNTSLLIIFIPMLGSYVVPDLIGGTDGQMIGNKIAQRNFADRNLPAASAMAALLTLCVLTPLILRRKDRSADA